MVEMVENWVQESRKHPIQWIHRTLGVSTYSKEQAAILDELPRALEERKPLVVTSGHAQGKDFLTSCISPWFLYNYAPSKVIFTAPTDRQVKEIMWNEIETRLNSSTAKLPGRVLKCKIDISSDHFLIGFTTRETGNMTGKFQGFHSPNILMIVSEAQAVNDKIYEQIDGILTSKNALLIMIGNPLRTTGKFARMIKDTTNNIVVRLNCLDSPNYRYKKEVIPGMASYEWVEERRRIYGEDHPLWFAKVLGLLPNSSIDTVFASELMDMTCLHKPNVVKRLITVAVDPARMGDDDTVIQGMISGETIIEEKMPLSKAPAVCSKVLQVVKKLGANRIICETDGLGGPISDFIGELKPDDVELLEVCMGGDAEDKERFANSRAEVYYSAREMAEEGKVACIDDEKFKEELGEPIYFYDGKGRIQIEPKKDIKSRLGRSPDRADCWVLNCWGQKTAEPIIGKRDGWDNSKKRRSSVSTGVLSAMTA